MTRIASFQMTAHTSDTSSRFGTLKIPNSYGIAYIIDGQHRLYGYANSPYKKNNTIPVVAFAGLSSIKQLELFMNINQNQKAVSPSLRLDLEEDLYWDSERVESRLKALRSSIIKGLANPENGPLFDKISIGEDSSILTFKPFYAALSHSGLLPNAKGNKYTEETTKASLYNINNLDHNDEMNKAKRKIIKLLNMSYNFVEENYSSIFRDKYFIISNRGTYAFICLIGNLNKFLTQKGCVNYNSSSKERFLHLEKYLKVLLDYIENIPKDEEEKQLSLLGAGADIKWLRFFQIIIHNNFKDYEPSELIEWKERQNEELQDKGRKYGVAIEKYMKQVVLDKIKRLYGDNWELEIFNIQNSCQERAGKEMEKNYKENLGKKDIPWTDMFNINDYKTIIKKYWTTRPKNLKDNEKFHSFEEIFSINIDDKNSKDGKTKWISYLNSYRNLWAHEGTKETRLSKKEVEFLDKIHSHLL